MACTAQVLDYLTNMGGYTGFTEEELKGGGLANKDMAEVRTHHASSTPHHISRVHALTSYTQSSYVARLSWPTWLDCLPPVWPADARTE